MTTAKEFASAAANIQQLATQFKPDEKDPYMLSCKQIQYHLISAATRAREIAEALAQKEQNG